MTRDVTLYANAAILGHESVFTLSFYIIKYMINHFIPEPKLMCMNLKQKYLFSEIQNISKDSTVMKVAENYKVNYC